MIKVKANKKKYYIKTSWEELTYGEYLDILKAPDELTSISILSSIPVEILMRLDEASLYSLTTVLSFMQQLPEPAKDCKDIKRQTYGQKIILENALKLEDKNLIPLYALACYEYDYQNIEKAVTFLKSKPFKLVYQRGMNYLNQLTEVIKMESEHLKSSVTIEQKQAGIDMFNEFGVMNTVNRVAGGDLLKYEEVLKIDYNTVFVKQKMLSFDAKFQKAYTKIMNNKRK